MQVYYNNELLTVDEIKLILKIGRNQVYKLVTSQDFPSFRMGKRILVSRKALEKWMDSKTE